mgnify:FL=1
MSDLEKKIENVDNKMNYHADMIEYLQGGSVGDTPKHKNFGLHIKTLLAKEFNVPLHKIHGYASPDRKYNSFSYYYENKGSQASDECFHISLDKSSKKKIGRAHV